MTTNGFLKLLKKRISLHNSGLEDLKDEMGHGEVSKREGSSTGIQENKILTCLYNAWKMLQSGMSDLLLKRSSPSWKRKVTLSVTSRTGDKAQTLLEPKLLNSSKRRMRLGKSEEGSSQKQQIRHSSKY